MSSCVVVSGHGGLVVSTDSIVLKHISGGLAKGLTRKLFQIRPDLLVGATGNWNSYFPILNSVARIDDAVPALVSELHALASKAEDISLHIIYRRDGKPSLDSVEAGSISADRAGVVSYPEAFLRSLFMAMYEAPEGIELRQTGLLGIAAIVNAYNAFADSLSTHVSAPFDTVLFLEEGIFPFSGGVTSLPVGEFV